MRAKVWDRSSLTTFKVDWKLIAEKAGYKTAASAQEMFRRFMKKLKAGSDAVGSSLPVPQSRTDNSPSLSKAAKSALKYKYVSSVDTFPSLSTVEKSAPQYVSGGDTFPSLSNVENSAPNYLSSVDKSPSLSKEEESVPNSNRRKRGFTSTNGENGSEQRKRSKKEEGSQKENRAVVQRVKKEGVSRRITPDDSDSYVEG